MELLKDKILDHGTVTKDIIVKWNSVINTLENHIVNTINISPVIAEKYRFDMYGLFKYLQIPDKYIYPHIRVNGYNSSNCYNGEKVEISILDINKLAEYYRMFTS